MSDDTSASVSSIDPIVLVLPPRPELSRVARLASSALASIAGCTVDEIEDIKIAVSEVLLALIEHGAGNPIERGQERSQRQREGSARSQQPAEWIIEPRNLRSGHRPRGRVNSENAPVQRVRFKRYGGLGR